MELIAGLIDKYGPQTVLMAGAAFLLYKAIMFGMNVLNRMSETQAESTHTQNTIDQGQMQISLQAMRMSEASQERTAASQERLAELQRAMIDQQQASERVQHRLTDELTHAVLQVGKSASLIDMLVERIKELFERINDWDARIGLYLRRQEDQAGKQIQIIGLLNTILASITAQDIAHSKDIAP